MVSLAALNISDRLPPDQVLTTFIPADISRIDKYAPAQLIGREAEAKLLSEAWAKAQANETKRPRLLTFVALGGEGKTSLVAKWAVDLAYCGWPGCEAAFAWSFYSQGTRELLAASSDLFLAAALRFFDDSAMAESAQSAHDKGRRLAQLVGAKRALLILDGLEPLQYSPASPTPGELKDEGIIALLKSLAQSSRGLCVVTTRYSIRDLRAYWQGVAPEIKLHRLSREAGVALLHARKIKGPQEELERLVEEVKGHALTLNLLGSYLRDAYDGDIFRRDLVRLEEANREEENGHAFRAMDAYVAWFQRDGDKGLCALAMLRLMGLFDRPAEADCLAALWAPPAIAGITEPLIGLREALRSITLQRLEDAGLVTVIRDSGRLVFLDAHPLLREYFAKTLCEENVEGWRAAHRRLYEYLSKTTPDKKEPKLDDLQPLYRAVIHGCRAGLQQEAFDKIYYNRILRGEEYYPQNLGAYGPEVEAVACFFDELWSRTSPRLKEATRGWLLSQAAFRLRGLGRLSEALEPARAAMKMAIEEENWSEAAIRAANLSSLELTLGEFTAAVADGEASVAFADRSGKIFQRVRFRATYADALHQSDKREEALARFTEAERIQAQGSPEYRLLYRLDGFRYCDLLLADAERSAWRLLLQPSSGAELSSLIESCCAVSDRAVQTFQLSQRNNPKSMSSPIGGGHLQP
jgi:hypothetical protein